MATINRTSFPASEVVSCPACNEDIALYDPEGSGYVACGKCNSWISFDERNVAVRQGEVQGVVMQPVLPLGTEGVINGLPYKVIAYLEKKEEYTDYCWREYILYNYEKGYATLAEFDGHWTIVAGKAFYPDIDDAEQENWDLASFRKTSYRLFNKYTALVTGLKGELDWDPLDEKVSTAEFIAPPHILFVEKGSKGIAGKEAYWGVYVEAAVLAESFSVDLSGFPEKTGIGANQPGYTDRWKMISKLTGIAIIALLLIQLVTILVKRQEVIVNDYFHLTFDPATNDEFKPFTTPTFKISDRMSAMEFVISSEVDNNWLEATVVLVNEATNDTWEVTEGIEYYQGYEDGEHWTEGSHEVSIMLSSIPAGNYHLNVYPVSGDTLQSNVHIKIIANVRLWGNLLITCGLLLLYPLYCWWRMWQYEKKRWLNSDYSPYETE